MSGTDSDLAAILDLVARMNTALREARDELRELKHGQSALGSELRVEIASLRGELAHYHAAMVSRGES